MTGSRDDFLMNLLSCGICDLKLIDDVGYDWCDILKADTISEIADWKASGKLAINAVMTLVVEHGIEQIETAINDRICELEAIPNERELDDVEENELVALRTLNPWEDIESFHNCIDTHIWFEQNADVYRTFLLPELNDFADGTGFEIGGD